MLTCAIPMTSYCNTIVIIIIIDGGGGHVDADIDDDEDLYVVPGTGVELPTAATVAPAPPPRSSVSALKTAPEPEPEPEPEMTEEEVKEEQVMNLLYAAEELANKKGQDSFNHGLNEDEEVLLGFSASLTAAVVDVEADGPALTAHEINAKAKAGEASALVYAASTVANSDTLKRRLKESQQARMEQVAKMKVETLGKGASLPTLDPNAVASIEDTTERLNEMTFDFSFGAPATAAAPPPAAEYESDE